MNKKIVIISAIIVIFVIFAVFYFDTRSDYQFQNSPRPIWGNPAATVKIVVFSDFQCPFCAQAHEELKKIFTKYSDKISVEFKHYPLPSHFLAFQEAEASECANDQGRFWEYADLLFSNQNNINSARLSEIAGEVGLDTGKFGSCLDSGVNKIIVSQDIEQGNQENVKGTPTFFLNNKEVSWTNLDAKIAEELGL